MLTIQMESMTEPPQRKSGHSIVSRICNILSILLFILLFVVAALLVVPKLLGYQQYAVLSGSMEPKIPVGSMLFDKPYVDESLEVGDIVTYAISDTILVTHRIVDIDQQNQTITTKGDANDTNDSMPIAINQIKGTYGFMIPYLGYISIYGKTPLGISVVCILLAIIILLNIIPELFAGKRNSFVEKERNNYET